jgi:hypothetical protein
MRDSYKILVENLKGREHLGDLGADGRIYSIRMDLQEIGWDSVDWTRLSEDREQWRALVNE